jgi:hypothetical protein
MDYCLETFPVLQHIPRILHSVDLTNPDRSIIKQQILSQLEPYMHTANDPGFGHGIWALLAWNI